jgi:hypothetical protein
LKKFDLWNVFLAIVNSLPPALWPKKKNVQNGGDVGMCYFTEFTRNTLFKNITFKSLVPFKKKQVSFASSK